MLKKTLQLRLTFSQVYHFKEMLQPKIGSSNACMHIRSNCNIFYLINLIVRYFSFLKYINIYLPYYLLVGGNIWYLPSRSTIHNNLGVPWYFLNIIRSIN